MPLRNFELFTFLPGSRPYFFGISILHLLFGRPCLFMNTLAQSVRPWLYVLFGLSLLPLQNFDFFTLLLGFGSCRFGTSLRLYRALADAASELQFFHVPLGLSPLPHRNMNFFTFVSVALVLSKLRLPHVPVGLSPLLLRFRPWS